jgi:hypothetical protein
VPSAPALDPLSWSSVRIQPAFDGYVLASATGITIRLDDTREYIVTNWHVVSGRDANTGEPLDKKTAAIPNQLIVEHHDAELLGRWHVTTYDLLTETGEPLWRNHPAGGGPGGMDVVALPIVRPQGTRLVPFPLDLANSDAKLAVGGLAHVIGFPSGLGVAGKWPIWLTGHLATDPELDYDHRPILLIDARTRGGMSGAPVITQTDQIRLVIKRLRWRAERHEDSLAFMPAEYIQI